MAEWVQGIRWCSVCVVVVVVVVVRGGGGGGGGSSFHRKLNKNHVLSFKQKYKFLIWSYIDPVTY